MQNLGEETKAVLSDEALMFKNSVFQANTACVTLDENQTISLQPDVKAGPVDMTALEQMMISTGFKDFSTSFSFNQGRAGNIAATSGQSKHS